MYWEAGQARNATESRHRMAEMYRSVTDAYVGARVNAGQWKTKGTLKPPSYLDTPDKSAPKRGLRDLMRDFGGQVESAAPGEFVRGDFH